MRGVSPVPIVPRHDSRLPCYVLTLDSPFGARYRSAAGQLAQLPLDVTFVHGLQLTNSTDSARYCRWRNGLYMKRPLTAGEVAVYLGHRRIWRWLLSAGHEVALVLEDDFVIADRSSLLNAIADARTLPIDWDIVKFFDFKPKAVIRRWRTSHTEFVTYKYPPSGCVAYLIRAAAAARLLDRRRIYRPIDEDWSHPWESDLRIISVAPSPVAEAAAQLGGSLLERERQAVKGRHRSILRSLHGMLLMISKNARARRWRRQCDALLSARSSSMPIAPSEARSKAAA